MYFLIPNIVCISIVWYQNLYQDFISFSQTLFYTIHLVLYTNFSSPLFLIYYATSFMRAVSFRYIVTGGLYYQDTRIHHLYLVLFSSSPVTLNGYNTVARWNTKAVLFFLGFVMNRHTAFDNDFQPCRAEIIQL